MPATHSLGILGGTFNPPHLGHIAIAEHARAELGLERVALVPSHTPPHKRPLEDPGPQRRLAMCELALAGHRGLCACALEIERGGPSYTVDTLKALHDLHPDTRLTLILGSDMARTLPAWRRPRELLTLADLAVAERPGDARADVLAALAQLDASGRVSFLSMPPLDISSSQVRERIADREGSCEDLVGSAVAGYIAQHGLYRNSASDRVRQ